MTRPKTDPSRTRAIIIPEPDCRVIRATTLDRVADLELVMGHHAIAEGLARMASKIREGAR